MAAIYDDPAVAYDNGLVTYDGGENSGSMSGAITESATMTGTITY